jgi:large subunit ribosomal protein L23
MNEERLMNIILTPHVSEKATVKADVENQHVFSVAKDANKFEVKKAVEKMFEVKVQDVRLLNVHGKLKKVRGRYGKTKDWKKAYVRLKEGFDINYGEAEAKP